MSFINPRASYSIPDHFQEEDARQVPGLPFFPGRINLVDTHVHTHYSDGSATVTEVEDICRAKDIGCVITDHNEIRGSVKLFERDRVSTLPALELGSKEQIELIIFFKDAESCEEYYRAQVEPFRTRRWYAYLPRSLDYLIAGAMELETFISIPHPYAPLWKNIEYGRKRQATVLRAINAADGIEVQNGGLTKRANRRAWEFCERLERVPLGGSDSHDLDTIGKVVTAFNQAVTSKNLFEAMADDRVHGILTKNGRSAYISKTWHLVARHSRKFILPQGLPFNGFRS